MFLLQKVQSPPITIEKTITQMPSIRCEVSLEQPASVNYKYLPLTLPNLSAKPPVFSRLTHVVILSGPNSFLPGSPLLVKLFLSALRLAPSSLSGPGSKSIVSNGLVPSSANFYHVLLYYRFSCSSSLCAFLLFIFLFSVKSLPPFQSERNFSLKKLFSSDASFLQKGDFGINSHW